MNSVMEYRSWEAVIDPYIVDYRYCGGFVDEISRRLGNVEADVSKLKDDVGEIRAKIPSLAEKSDLEKLRTDLKTEIAGVRIEVTELRTELKTEIAGIRIEVAEVRTDLGKEIAGVRTELGKEIGGVRTELGKEIGGLRADMASMETRITKWLIATVLTAAGMAFSIAKFVH